MAAQPCLFSRLPNDHIGSQSSGARTDFLGNVLRYLHIRLGRLRELSRPCTNRQDSLVTAARQGPAGVQTLAGLRVESTEIALEKPRGSSSHPIVQ